MPLPSVLAHASVSGEYERGRLIRIKIGKRLGWVIILEVYGKVNIAGGGAFLSIGTLLWVCGWDITKILSWPFGWLLSALSLSVIMGVQPLRVPRGKSLQTAWLKYPAGGDFPTDRRWRERRSSHG